MTDSRTFKKGETVIVYDGGHKRSSVELAEVGADCSYSSNEILLTFGNFNTRHRKSSVHKLPATLKKALKTGEDRDEPTNH